MIESPKGQFYKIKIVSKSHNIKKSNEENFNCFVSLCVGGIVVLGANL